MKALFIGGTGNISTEVSKLAVKRGWELYLLNRGNREVPEGAHSLTADIKDENAVAELIAGMNFDVVADFIAFAPLQIERDIRLFADNTRQFIFISSASAYQKPLAHYRITESTPLSNPYWQYSQDKIACEDRLMLEYRKSGFPITIIRPSHTYGDTYIPLAVSGSKGSWQVIDRIIKGKPVVIHGDGTSLWTVTHNTDFAKAFIGIMGNHAAVGESIHITSDEVLTWDEMYDCMGAALGCEVKKVHVTSDFLSACDPEFFGNLIGDKAVSAVFDNAKIKRLVPDFVATTRYETGIRMTIDYHLAHTELQVPDEAFDHFCDNVINAQHEALSYFHKLSD